MAATFGEDRARTEQRLRKQQQNDNGELLVGGDTRYLG